MAKFLLGSIIAIIIAAAANRSHTLNKRGALGAAFLGSLVLGLGGLSWGIILLSFFISASLLSIFFKKQKVSMAAYASKGSHRDLGQVLANGAAGGFFVVLYVVLDYFFPEVTFLPVLWIGFAASFAGANADTWATEMGVLNRSDPVLLTSFKRVPKGASGGVSLVGTFASLAGAFFVAGIAVLTQFFGWTPHIPISSGKIFLFILIGGVFGSLLDSALGATLQVIYYCPQCDLETEKTPQHSCGTNTCYRRGIPWLNNDWVNAACTVSAGLVGMLLAYFF